ncbi:DUF4279 domain-containing protein [Streptomyces hoynatensis]|uniref:DUF4279 domain-containing protein n=1 Tax=Streptomyces hoynatensis TaxID=1141874 RepID=A0A3A9YU03_9ACTN|nr:DUF4279 domain-containing protein [Streptomyces hoynatensis]RKN39259.1 DUF4279 domain-containing protein [Streptomyces hoynatensis]
MMGSERQWAQLAVTLLVSGADLDPGSVTERLGVPPDFSRAPGAVPAFRAGAGCWGLVADAPGTSLPSLLDALLARVRPLSAQLRALRAEGHRVSIDVSGLVESGAELTLPPDVLSRVNELGLALSFSTEAPVTETAEDLLDQILDQRENATEQDRG